ncbi:uncharacterized protein BDV14DRAFT_33258 [Aspergillus stella-maris]|uniref:uncharacterized protein n=1 Tax=Aspergillus stella-maris TaxID=1810926 RepID=UPI003CCD1721
MHEVLNSQAADTRSRVIELLQEIVNTGADFDFECDEFRAIISRLCRETPDFARSIQENISNTISKSPTRSKRKQTQDPSYRPPKIHKSTSLQVYSTNTTKDPEQNAKDTISVTTGSTPRASSSAPVEEVTKCNQQNTKDTTSVTRRIPRASSSNPVVRSDTHFKGAVSVSVTVDDAINTISEITKHQGGPLVKDIHGCILRLLKGEKGATAGFESWPHLLDAAHFESQRRDIFIFLEYLGASDWYERKIDLATKTVRTKQGKPATRRGAAIHVLKEVLKNVDPGTETTVARRNRLNTHLTRGRRLRSLVDKFGRGILFNTKL